MDELVAATGLAKMTVYRLYPTKDALVGAYLDRLSATILDLVDQDIASRPGDPAGALQAILDAIAADIGRPGFRGCPFGNAAADFDDPTHPARIIAAEHRHQLRQRLTHLSRQLPHGNPNLGDQLATLIDGSYLNAAHLGPTGPAQAGIALARQLITTANH